MHNSLRIKNENREKQKAEAEVTAVFRFMTSAPARHTMDCTIRHNILLTDSHSLSGSQALNLICGGVNALSGVYLLQELR